MRMLSKSKHFYCLYPRQARWCLKSIHELDYVDNVNIAGSLLHNAFSTVSLHAIMSVVKLPGKKTGQENSEDDDFVPPSVSDWIDNHKICDREAGVNSTGNDIIESDIDKISKILKNGFESPDLVVKALGGCDVDVAESLVEQVLKRFSNQWVPSFGFFEWAKLHKGIAYSADIYNLMVDILGKAKKFDIMWELVEEMKTVNGCIMLDTMTKVMKRLAKACKYDDAIEAFGRMELLGIKHVTTAMNILIACLVKGGSTEHADRVYVEYKDRIPPNTETYNMLVHGWCRSGQIGKATKTVDEMKKHGICPNVITYTSFIETYCRQRDFPKVIATLEEIRKNGCHPTVVTYTVIMTALAKSDKSDKALEIYEQMKKDDCHPDVMFYTAFIHALSQAGRLKYSDTVFEDMSKVGVAPNVDTYNALILVAAKNLEEDKALNLLRRMEENQCKPNLKTYAPLLKMCCRLKRMKVLSFLLDHMFKNDVSIDPGTYSLLIVRLTKNAKLDRACYFFEEMVLEGFVPLDHAYELLIKRLEKNGMHEERQRVEELMGRAKRPGFGHSSASDATIED